MKIARGIENNPECAREELEAETVQFFVGLARLAGYPRSVGEIFGVLFASERPLAFEEIGERRQISAGSVSMGLRHLKRSGAVISVPIIGERREHFTVNTQFKQVTARFFRLHMEPIMLADMERIDRLRHLAGELPDGPRRRCVAGRIKELDQWHGLLREFMAPLLTYR